ncbi:PQQ-binding-like beta-propeller repeat protein [uncultured Jatrophihabitans sp.]|uniref:outer membrane protein assembly factor BamB family protein n=1 Tax=uncultured Jatrophihabitans sp. TaxID=1610747 RepID=UPI0035CBEF50
MRTRLSLIVLVLLAVAGYGSAGYGTGTKAAAASGKPVDWPTYHLNTYRNASYPSMPAFTKLAVTKKLALDGQVYASPIVINGTVIVATENNTVYAFDSSYRQLWKRHLGTPARLSQLPCGNIDPLGITGTPVYSPSTRQVYVAAEFGGTSPTHRLYALSFASGRVRFSRTLDLPGVDRRAMQERGALTIVGSRVYVPFGGLAGDCGQYKGRVIAYPITGTGSKVYSYTVPTSREAGIWTPPGPTADSAKHILVAVGNGASGSTGRYDHSDSVLELSRTLRLTDSFSPTTWRPDNDADKDLGSQGPAIVGNYVFQAGKSGTAYVLRRDRLGGIGGQVSQATVCRSFGGTARRLDVVYVPCADGVRAVRVDARGRMHILWHAADSVAGSPTYGGGRLFSIDAVNGVLHALSLTTGRTTQSVDVGVTSRFATVAEYGRLIYVPTQAGLTVVRTS